MTGAKTIGCINHPGIEAVGRCRQCSKPVCRQCGAVTSTGLYCSEVCRAKYEEFLRKAGEIDLDNGVRRGFFLPLRNFVGGLFTLAAVLTALGFLATVFEIPLLSQWTVAIRRMLGI